MRTTLTLDPDVAVRIKRDAARADLSIKQLVNDALRMGLAARESAAASGKPYRVRPTPMELRAGLNIDNVAELLAHAEGDDPQ